MTELVTRQKALEDQLATSYDAAIKQNLDRKLRDFDVENKATFQQLRSYSISN
jgi:hypothetical protein